MIIHSANEVGGLNVVNRQGYVEKMTHNQRQTHLRANLCKQMQNFSIHCMYLFVYTSIICCNTVAVGF